MKKIVVLGGAGFLGSYIVDALLKKKYEVVIADIAPSPYIDSTLFKKIDILNAQEVESLIDKNTFAVYNLAGFSNLDKATEFPYSTFQLNVLGNINVLEACKKAEVKMFIYASSAYAMSNKGSFYGISKLTSEKVIQEYHKRYGLEYSIVRYGSVYSERNYENNYIFNVVKEALENGKIVHSGDGEEMREYIHASDAARLSVEVLENNDYHNEILMLTGVERMKRIEVFNMINEIIGGTVNIQLSKDGYAHHYKTTPYSFQPESSKKLVANPFVDMGQGILECIKAIKNTHE